MQTGRTRRWTRQRRGGFVYLGLLWMLAVTAAGLAFVGESWTHAAQRERERELIFRGEQIRTAIDRYRRAIPTRNEWPKSLHELVEDRREGEVRYHLRRSFEDPFAQAEGWAEIRDPAGGLIGVRSRSNLPPLSRWPRDAGHAGMARRLSDWRFAVVETDAANAVAGPLQGGQGLAPAIEVPR